MNPESFSRADRAEKRNLVMTTVHRFEAPELAPYFQSLKRAGFQGDVVVFASVMSASSKRQIEAWGARVVSFRFPGRHVANRAARLWWVWRRLFASSISRGAKEVLAHAVFHLFYRRHLLYLEYLRRNGSQYDGVFTTDCRDVYFQADPFAWERTPGLHVFLEEAIHKVGKCKHHQRWIRALFDEGVLQELSEKTVTCAGTVLGDVPSMMDYLEKMVTSAMRANKLSEADGDQGLHNYLVHTGQLPGVTVHPNRTGPVMTMGLMGLADFQMNGEGLVINDLNELVPTLHQYDRIPQVREPLLRRLV
jgi:hypothetical protein